MKYASVSLLRPAGLESSRLWSTLLALATLGVRRWLLDHKLCVSIDMHLGSLHGIPGHIFRLAPGIFDLPLHLLRDAFNLKLRVPRQLASLALGASDYFVNRSLHSVLIHKYISVGSVSLDS